MVFDDSLQQQARLHGPLPGFQQDILLAELHALWWHTRHLCPFGGRFYTDSKSLVAMWQTGPARCCDAFSVYSGIWRLIWGKIDDVGPQLVTTSWIKGHATAAHIEAGVVTEFQRTSNGIADLQAKAGSAMHLPVAQAAASIAASSYALEWIAIYVGLAHAKLWRAKPIRHHALD